jgi:hypothetical protein
MLKSHIILLCPIQEVIIPLFRVPIQYISHSAAVSVTRSAVIVFQCLHSGYLILLNNSLKVQDSDANILNMSKRNDNGLPFSEKVEGTARFSERETPCSSIYIFFLRQGLTVFPRLLS